MIYQRIHEDSQRGFCLYRGKRGGDILHDDLILVATLPGLGRREIAVRLEDPEPILFVHYGDCFPDLVEDFIGFWESPKYRSRLLSIRHVGTNAIECVTEPSGPPNGDPAEPPANSDAGGGPPSVS